MDSDCPGYRDLFCLCDEYLPGGGGVVSHILGHGREVPW